MRPATIFLGVMLAAQIVFDMMMFDYIIHGEVAWRWLQGQSTAFRNSADTYPGYYCGQHSCTLDTAPGDQ